MPKDGMDALLIAAGPPKLPGGRDEPAGDEPGAGGAKIRAARGLRQAIERKDDGAIAAAFKRMYDICAAGHGESEETAEGGEEY